MAAAGSKPGMTEISSYLTSTKLEDVRLVQGVTTSTSKSSAAIVRDSAISLTAPIHEGSVEDPVAAFQGDVATAISFYEQSLPIAEALAAKDRTNATLQKDVQITRRRLKELRGEGS